MPAKSAEQIKQKAQALRTKIAEKGTALTPDKVRAMKKKVRRLQRRRRALDARAKRLAPAPTPSE
ncbi:MAG TPA: hypothetical protein VMT33_00525 [Candidatus Bathyarchaeia archaeon]|nr:hypothetical protein [Candidatus Bathyarchaeia archaeon]